jgi:transposase InsO family protein
MGSVADAYDNAMVESFFGTFRIELAFRFSWLTRHAADMAIFEWLETWYNPRRIQKALGWRSPAEFEADHLTDPLTDPTHPTEQLMAAAAS